MSKEKHTQLTPKQEMFCQEFVKTGNASQSYRIAYPKSVNWKDESVNCEASKLMVNTKVLQRVQELQTKQEEKHDISKDKIVNRLKEIIFAQDTIHDGKIDLSAMNKSIDILNKMQGYYAPEKVEHSGTLDINTLTERLIGK